MKARTSAWNASVSAPKPEVERRRRRPVPAGGPAPSRPSGGWATSASEVDGVARRARRTALARFT